MCLCALSLSLPVKDVERASEAGMGRWRERNGERAGMLSQVDISLRVLHAVGPGVRMLAP